MQKESAALAAVKKKRTIDTTIARSAHRRGFDIYSERLKMVQVTQSPMMTYRILGFGGKMFAAPFVTRLVDWIDLYDRMSPIP
jgi:hypothetical protein